jgi:hypothetical protein
MVSIRLRQANLVAVIKYFTELRLVAIARPSSHDVRSQDESCILFSICSMSSIQGRASAYEFVSHLIRLSNLVDTGPNTSLF